MFLLVARAREKFVASGRTDEDPLEDLRDGRAMDVWRRMISAQGGDPDAPLPTAKETETVTAERDGVLTRLDAYAAGGCAGRLGAGRGRQGDAGQAAARGERRATARAARR